MLLSYKKLQVILRNKPSAFRFPVEVFAEHSDSVVSRVSAPELSRLLDAGCVTGHGTADRVRALRMVTPANVSDERFPMASEMNIRRLPCAGDVRKALTVVPPGGAYRQWRMPHPRPRPDQNRRNNEVGW